MSMKKALTDIGGNFLAQRAEAEAKPTSSKSLIKSVPQHSQDGQMRNKTVYIDEGGGCVSAIA